MTQRIVARGASELVAGATSIEEASDVPYGDRRAMVVDRWGNTWQIATRMSRAR